MKRVIIDCDPSADDALALMLAAASAELSLEAVTAVPASARSSRAPGML